MHYRSLFRLFSLLVTALVFFIPQTTPAEEKSGIGVAPHEEKALELIGRSEQNGPVVTHYGYLTHIFGLADKQLFSDPNTRTEATARFTFFATTTITSRHELGNIITTAVPGTLTIYFNEAPGGNFADPGSFGAGQPLTTHSVSYHNVLNVQAPDQGISSAFADLVQLSADSFILEGRRYRLGHKGLRERIWATGQGTRTQVDPLRAFFLLGGNIVVTGR